MLNAPEGEVYGWSLNCGAASSGTGDAAGSRVAVSVGAVLCTRVASTAAVSSAGAAVRAHADALMRRTGKENKAIQFFMAGVYDSPSGFGEDIIFSYLI